MSQLVNVEALRLRMRKAEDEINTAIDRFKLDTGLFVKAVTITNLDTSNIVAKSAYSYASIEVSFEL